MAPSTAYKTPAFAWARRSVFLVLAWSLPVSLFGMQLGAIAGAVLVAILLVQGRLESSPLDKPILLLLLAIGLSLALASRTPSSFRTATSFWVLVSFYVSFFLIDGRQTLLRALWGVFGLACAAALFAVYQSLTGHYPLGALIHPHLNPLLELAPGKEDLFGGVGLFFSRLTFAHVLLFPLCWAGALLLEGLAWRWRLALLFACGLLATGLFFTWTRAGLAAGVLVLIGLAAARLPRGWKRWTAIGALVVSSLAAVAFVPAVQAKLGQAFAGKKDWGRLAIWHSALDLAAERPLTGIGYGNFQRDVASKIEMRRAQMGGKRFKGTLAWAHNNLLTFLAEAGALGVLAFVWIFVAYYFAAARVLLRVREDPLLRGFVRGSMGAVAAFLLVGIFHDTFFDGEVIFCLWFCMGSSLAVGRFVSAPEGAGA